MKVELDFGLLTSIGMSPDDYVYLYLIHKKGLNYIPQLNLKPNLDALQEQGYVKLGDTPVEHKVRQKFLDLFLSNFEQMFAELTMTYPMKVTTDKRDVRILHAKDPLAKSNLKARQKYRKIVDGKLYKHKHIIASLNKQLRMERDRLGYLQNLETWINNHTWEKYENLDEDDTKASTGPRITRSL